MSNRLAVVLLVVMIAASEVQADVVANTDAVACPSIADHQRFFDEMAKQNWRYEYPPKCPELPMGGRRMGGPFETREERHGTSTTTYVLIEVPGKGRLWTLRSWVDVVDEASPPPIVAYLSDSNVWYASLLRSRFGSQLTIQGIDYATNRLPCLPQDITRFKLTTRRDGPHFFVEGSVALRAIPSPFSVIDGANGSRYMLVLEAFLISPSGKVLWQQSGFPKGSAWVRSTGQSVSFRLVDRLVQFDRGSELIIIAAGDPIMSSTSEFRVLLGAKRMSIP